MAVRCRHRLVHRYGDGFLSLSLERVTVEPEDLGRAAVRGVAWQGVSQVAGKVLVLVSTAILARILAPEDFGLVALALVFIAYAEVITDLGSADAVVFMPSEGARAETAAAVAIGFGVAIAAISAACAGLVASFFGRPDVAPLFRVLSVALAIGAAGQVPDALLRKRLAFRRRMGATLVRVSVQGALSIALAVAGLRGWAIVWGYLGGVSAWAVVAWCLVSPRPVPRVHRDALREVMRYGAPAALHELLTSLVFDIDYLIVGRALGAAALAFYAVGFRIPELVVVQVFYVLSAVAFPAMTLTRDDPVRFRRGYLLSLRVQSVYGVAAGVGLAIIAPMLVHVVFGERWSRSVVPLTALACYAAFRSIGTSASDVYKAMGRPGLAAKVSLARLAVLVPTLWLAARGGIDAVAVAQAVAAFVLAIGMQAIAMRLIGVDARSFLAALGPALLAGAGVAAGAAIVRVWVPGPEVARLVAALVAGAAGGACALWLGARDSVEEMRALLRRASGPRAEIA